MSVAEIRLEEVGRRVSGRILQGSPSILFRGFTIDSRLVRAGDLFFAVIGNRDGHDFIPQAAANGALGAVVSANGAAPGKDFALVRVEDTVRALQDLARTILADTPIPVVGITGSVGKTTTKEFTAEILSSRYSVLRSEKNFNNHLGLALSILKLEKKHQVAVLEMATSAPGEIAGLTRIAPPDISVITNIHPVHLQFFGSMEGIALAKKEILDGTKSGGTAVLNGDDPLVTGIAASWKGPRVVFGRSPACDVRASNIRHRGYEGLSLELTYGGKRTAIDLPFIYESFVDDFLAAAAAAYAMSLPMEAVIAKAPSLKPYAMRGTLILLGKDIRLLDDSYNSNPGALDAALKTLALLSAPRRVAVLGDMLELGEKEGEFHAGAGRTAARSGWDLLVTVGPLARRMAEGAAAAGMDRARILSFADSVEAAGGLVPLLREGDLILIKGSRGLRMERIVEALKERIKE
jgi:UDP-N-acetylmuramoyl-tripeptide--D-alanyl-D-alanine ligase